MTFKQFYHKFSIWSKIVSGFVLWSIVLWFAFIQLKESNVSLREANHYKGIVTKSFLRDRPTTTAKNIALYNQVFCFRMEGLPERFEVFYTDRDYSNLQRSIIPGEVIEIYYNQNGDVLQIEKGFLTLYGYDDHNLKQKMLAYVLVFVGILLLSLQVMVTINLLKLYDKISWLNSLPKWIRKI